MENHIISGNYTVSRHLLNLKKMLEKSSADVEINSAFQGFENGKSIYCVHCGEWHTGNSSLEEVTLGSSFQRGLNSSSSRSIVPFRLPDNWKVISTIRTGGKTKGRTDKYYVEPNGRKFRSKNEVMNFLETGRKKRKLTPEEDAGQSSGSPESRKQKKSSVKPKTPVP